MRFVTVIRNEEHCDFRANCVQHKEIFATNKIPKGKKEKKKQTKKLGNYESLLRREGTRLEISRQLQFV